MLSKEDITRITKGELLPLPELAQKILTTFLTKSEREIQEFLTEEEEVRSFLIETANLPRFRKAEEPVNNARSALLILGDTTAKILALSLVGKKLTRPTFNEFSYEKFWARALSQLIAGFFFADIVENFPPHLPISAYLQDFGILLLYQFAPEKYLTLLRKREGERALVELERELFGITHPEIGALYFEAYNFPRRFILNVRYHHEQPKEALPLTVEEDLKYLAIIDVLCGSFFGYAREERWQRFRELAKPLLSVAEIEELAESFPKIVNTYFQILGYERYRLKTLKEWEEEKQKELAELINNEKNETQALELTIEKLSAKILALKREKENLEWSLKELENEFRQRTYLDPETEVYTYSYMLRRLKEELLRANRYGSLFSILLIDLAELDEVTKKGGLSIKGEFLRDLFGELKRSLRRTDLLGLTDTENQFLLILPETGSSGARVVARKLLNKIEEKFYRTFEIRDPAFICVISYEPKSANIKQNPNEGAMLLLAKQGINAMKRVPRNRIVLLRLEGELKG